MARPGRPPKLYTKARRKAPIKRRRRAVEVGRERQELGQGWAAGYTVTPEGRKHRNLALAAALGQRKDPAARAALVSFAGRQAKAARSLQRKRHRRPRVVRAKAKPAHKRTWVRVKAHRRRYPG